MTSLARLQVRPTVLGWKAAVFWCAIFVAWLATPYSNLFFLLLCLLTTLAPLSLFFAMQNLRGLGATLQLQPYVADSEGPLLVDLVGPKKMPALAVEVSMLVEGARRAHAAGHRIEVRSGDRFLVHGPRLARGVHALRAAWIQSSAPYGLWKARRRIACPQPLVVYPRPRELPELRDRSALLAALRGDSSSPGADFAPAGLREFRDGDELRHVDWRASARRPALVVREWESDAIHGIEVSLDRRAKPEQLEEALSLATALLFLARDDKESFALSSQGLDGRYGLGHASYDDALRWLAACTALPSDAMAPPPVARDVLRLPLGGAR